MKSLLLYEELSTTELDLLDREKSLFLIPLSLLEEHGPHLPLGSDVYIARFMAEAVANRLKQEDMFDHLILMPSIPIGAGGIAMPGTIESEMSTVKTVLVEYGRGLSRFGFRNSLITSGHAGKRHLMAMEEACAELSGADQIRMLPLGSRLLQLFRSGGFVEGISRRLGRKFSSEELNAFTNDGHAGWWETSMLLLIRPDLVRDNFKTLPAADVLFGAGYHGQPARASADFARAAVAEIVEFSMDVIRDFFRPGAKA